MCMGFSPACISVNQIYIPGDHGSQKRPLELALELKLQTAVSSQVGAKNWVQVLWKAVGALNS